AAVREIEDLAGGHEAAGPHPLDDHLPSVRGKRGDPHPQRAQRAGRRVGVAAVQEPTEPAPPVGERGQDERPLRERLVARDPYAPHRAPSFHARVRAIIARTGSISPSSIRRASAATSAPTSRSARGGSGGACAGRSLHIAGSLPASRVASRPPGPSSSTGTAADAR